MEFGVVLIERGRESGGGETRSEVGTFARVLDLRVLEDGRYTLITVGTDRFEVVGWLPDDPYPVARVRRLVDVPPSIPIDGEALIARAVDLARRAGHDVEHPGETAVCPTFAAGAIAPIAEVDRQRLLRLADPGSEPWRSVRRWTTSRRCCASHRSDRVALGGMSVPWLVGIWACQSAGTRA